VRWRRGVVRWERYQKEHDNQPMQVEMAKTIHQYEQARTKQEEQGDCYKKNGDPKNREE
jgi:hypothetical protein